MNRARLRARAVLNKTVQAECGDIARLIAFGRHAALPARSVVDVGDERRLELRAPGATARSTEVRWDEARERLLVGVWCGKPPRRLELPLKYPVPELAWFASFHLPGFAGAHARASVENGIISIRVSKTRALLVKAVVRDDEERRTHDDESGPPPIPLAPDLLDMQAA